MEAAAVDVKCQNYMAVYKAISTDELFRLAYTDSGRTCRVLQTFRQPLPIVECHPEQFRRVQAATFTY